MHDDGAHDDGGGQAHGVLKLTLRPGGYVWEFVPAARPAFHDAGSGTCH